jgi:hypothetical protein
MLRWLIDCFPALVAFWGAPPLPEPERKAAQDFENRGDGKSDEVVNHDGEVARRAR